MEEKIRVGLMELERLSAVIPLGEKFLFDYSGEDGWINVYDVKGEDFSPSPPYGPVDFMFDYDKSLQKWLVTDFVSPAEGNPYINEDGVLGGEYERVADALFALVKYLARPVPEISTSNGLEL